LGSFEPLHTYRGALEYAFVLYNRFARHRWRDAMSFREKIDNSIGFLEEKLENVGNKSDKAEQKFADKHGDKIGKMQDRKDMAGESMHNFFDNLKSSWEKKQKERQRKKDIAEAKRLRKKSR
jgi:hypothetical protein